MDRTSSCPLAKETAKGVWAERHRNVARKIFLNGGWTQKRPFDIGWSDISKCQACEMEEGAEKSTGFTTVQNGTQKVGAKDENVEERM